jgi:hypothetical protein
MPQTPALSIGLIAINGAINYRTPSIQIMQAPSGSNGGIIAADSTGHDREGGAWVYIINSSPVLSSGGAGNDTAV